MVLLNARPAEINDNHKTEFAAVINLMRVIRQSLQLIKENRIRRSFQL